MIDLNWACFALFVLLNWPDAFVLLLDFPPEILKKI